MVFNFSQVYGEAVDLPSRLPWEVFVAFGVAIVLFIGSFVFEKIDGPGLWSHGAYAISVVATFFGMVLSLLYPLIAVDHNFVARFEDKYYLRSSIPENHRDLITGNEDAFNLTSVNVPGSKECMLSFNTSKTIEPGSVVYINKSTGRAIAIINDDTSRATELDYLVRENSKFYNRKEKLAEFDLSKYVSCDLVEESSLSDF